MASYTSRVRTITGSSSKELFASTSSHRTLTTSTRRRDEFKEVVRPPNAKTFDPTDYQPTSLSTPVLNNRQSFPTRLAVDKWLDTEGAYWKAPQGVGPFWLGKTVRPKGL